MGQMSSSGPNMANIKRERHWFWTIGYVGAACFFGFGCGVSYQQIRMSRHIQVHSTAPQNKFSFSSSDPDSFPFASILSLTNGQMWADRNMVMNACYQNYPKHKLELIIGESNTLANPKLRHYVEKLSDCRMHLRLS